MEQGTIRHMAIFRLKHPLDAPETRKFVEDGQRILTGIPSVRNFEVVRQISPKSDYDFGFSMEFAGQADYDAYNNHPDHQAFVRDRWNTEVEKFQEIDFTNV